MTHMNSDGGKKREPDIIERIANALPLELRAIFYEEMRHFNSLSEQDEMLHILRIIQILTTLMVEVPNRMVIEREKLEEIFGITMKRLTDVLQSSKVWQAELDERLKALPEAVERGIQPKAIVATITEGLRQQFVQTAMPETARAIQEVTTSFEQSAKLWIREGASLRGSLNGLSREMGETIQQIKSMNSAALTHVKEVSQAQHNTFQVEYRLCLTYVPALTLVLGFIFGMLLENWLVTPPRPPSQPPAIQSEAPAPTPKPLRK